MPSNNKNKRCVDCSHYIHKRIGAVSRWCGRPGFGLSSVTGKRNTRECTYERDYNYGKNGCGPDGNYFMKRDEGFIRRCIRKLGNFLEDL